MIKKGLAFWMISRCGKYLFEKKTKKTVRSVKIKTSKYKILELAVLSLGSNVAWFQMKNQTKAGVWYP